MSTSKLVSCSHLIIHQAFLTLYVEGNSPFVRLSPEHTENSAKKGNLSRISAVADVVIVVSNLMLSLSHCRSRHLRSALLGVELFVSRKRPKRKSNWKSVWHLFSVYVRCNCSANFMATQSNHLLDSSRRCEQGKRVLPASVILIVSRSDGSG